MVFGGWGFGSYGIGRIFWEFLVIMLGRVGLFKVLIVVGRYNFKMLNFYGIILVGGFRFILLYFL